jgi:predicted TIM-barrel fold metal-dependent hydrolase
MKHYVIISADCHAGPESPVYRDYIDPQYRDRFDEELKEREVLIAQRRTTNFGPGAMMGNEEFQDEWFGEHHEGESLHEAGLRGGWDAARRDKELDADGVTGEVVFPGPDAVTGRMGAPFGAGFNIPSTADPELVLAGARAYNRWAAELCQDSPDRRRGLAVAPILADIDGAVTEIRTAREEGLRGIIIPAQWGRYPSYTSDRYDPIWAVCQDLDMPVQTHSGPGAIEDYGTGPGVLGLYASETVWWTARPMWFMLWSGVFERFPRLRMAVTEAGSYWAADLLWRWDSLAMKDHGARKLADAGVKGHLSMRPSEYFDRNCGIGSSNTRRRELARRYEIGVDNMMWGNDFPHPEGTWPYTRKILREGFWDIPVDETERILGLNAAEFYDFDVAKLQPIADAIGPTPDELGQTDASVFAKWDGLKAAGRHWLTGREAVPAAVD